MRQKAKAFICNIYLIGESAANDARLIRPRKSGGYGLDGQWNDIVINFRFREDASGAYELEHNPIGLTLWYEVMSGNSDAIGVDGRPLIQQYSASMGAYQQDLIIDGGDF